MSGVMKTIWASVTVLVAVYIWVYGWDYYVAPQAAANKLAIECKFEANKIFALDISKWIDQNQTDINNPFRRQRDDFAATCVKKSGWCTLEIVAPDNWPCSWGQCFAPANPLAKWIYDLRYFDGKPQPCS